MSRNQKQRALKRTYAQAFGGSAGLSTRPAKKRRTGRARRGPKKAGFGRTGFNGMGPGSGFLGAAGPVYPNLAGKGVTRNQSVSRRDMVIEEDEYIQEVTVANQPNFNNVALPVNPGQAGTFPWLSTIAARFEKYEFDYLEFYYKREVSEFATNGQVGKVIIGFDSDATDQAPTTKQQMEDTVPHVDALPSENMSLIIPREMLHTRQDAHYVRPGAQPAQTDLKTFDLGTLNVATINIVNNVAVGELHVRYRVRLSIPVLEPVGVGPSKSSAFFQSSGAEAAGATTVAANLAVATAVANGLGVVNTSGSLVPPAGTYLMNADLFTQNASSQHAVVWDIKKNGVSIFPAGTKPIASGGSAAATGFNSSSAVSVLVSANGTDAFTIPVTITYAGGTQTMWADVTFVSA
jgi:hypothetical protein